MRDPVSDSPAIRLSGWGPDVRPLGPRQAEEQAQRLAQLEREMDRFRVEAGGSPDCSRQ